MTKTELDPRARLLAMNSAQRGSLGEFIFGEIVRSRWGDQVVVTHRDRCDFEIDGTPVDVKTTIRDLDRDLRPLRPYRGPRFEGIAYAQVEFGSGNGARVSLELEPLATLTGHEVAAYWYAWEGRTNPRRRPGPRGGGIAVVRAGIVEHFKKLGIEVRVIYRTIQKEFRDESPLNLVATAVRSNRLTIYLDFSGPRVDEDNIRRVFAFRDEDGAQFPVLKRTRLHQAKVDLALIPKRFVFKSLADLYANEGRILAGRTDRR